MSKIERGQFSDLLRRYLGMVGSSHVADDLAPEISPILVLEAERPEWEYLKGARLMSTFFEVSNSAVLKSMVRWRNPANSGIIAIFTSFNFFTSDGDTVSIAWNTDQGNLSVTLNTVVRDTRNVLAGNTNSSALVASQQNASFTGTTWYRSRQAVVESVLNPCAFVLTPGFQLDLGSAADNVTLTGSAQWLEKRLDELERTRNP